MPKHPFEYQAPTGVQVKHINIVREACKQLHGVLLSLPIGRERSLAITKLEEVGMWATKAVEMVDESRSEG